MYMIIVIKLAITVNLNAPALPANALTNALRNKHIYIQIGEITNPTIIDITRILFHGISKYTFSPEAFIIKIVPKNIINIKIDIII